MANFLARALGWKYEIGNQDRSLMQGVQLVDRWIDATEEKVPRS